MVTARTRGCTSFPQTCLPKTASIKHAFSFYSVASHPSSGFRIPQQVPARPTSSTEALHASARPWSCQIDRLRALGEGKPARLHVLLVPDLAKGFLWHKIRCTQNCSDTWFSKNMPFRPMSLFKIYSLENTTLQFIMLWGREEYKKEETDFLLSRFMQLFGGGRYYMLTTLLTTLCHDIEKYSRPKECAA